MNFKELAQVILEKVGGEKNVLNVVHCATRLRFNLKDSSIPNQDEIKKSKGVYGVVDKGGQFQVIIGNDVPNVYKELIKLGKFQNSTSSDDKGKSSKGFSEVLNVIAGIFVPAIPAIAGCGLLKAITLLLTTLGVLSPDSQSYYILSFAGDTAFYFLPIILAYTAATKFNCSPYLAMVLGGILLHPNFSSLVAAGESVSLFGLPVTLVKYGSSVVPIILIVWAMSYVQRFLDKYIPKALKIVFVPTLTILIMLPIALVVIGPLGTIVGDTLAKGIMFLDGKASWVLPLFFGITSPLLVMTGMHYSFFPAVFAQMASQGYQTLMPGMFVSNICQAAAALCVGIKSKNRDLKQLATSTGITALLGITEPALYGVTMKLKKPLYAVMAGGACGGLYAGIMGVKSYTPNGSSLLQLPVYVGPEMANVINALISVAIGFIVTFIVTWFLGFEDEANEEVVVKVEEKKVINKKISIESPVNGDMIPLSEVKDETFASEVIGKGVAFYPTEGKVFSPVDGSISALFKTNHAIGITSKEGVELLIHIGIDTVELEGEHFKAYVNSGDEVKAGDLLVEFELDKIKEKGYDIVTPLIVTNTDNYLEIIPEECNKTKKGDKVITII